MTSDESGGPGPGTPGSSRRRPPSTIDLEATEVASEPSSGPQASSGEASGEPETPHIEEGTDRGAAEAPRTEAVESTTNRGAFWPALGGGIIGAVVAAAALVALWLSGVLSPAQNPSEPQWTMLSGKVDGLAAQVRDLGARTDRVASPPPASAEQNASAKLAELDRRIDEALGAARDAQQRAETAAAQARKTDAQIPPNPAKRSEVESLRAQVGSLEQQVKTDEARLGKVADATDRSVRFALVAMELRIAVDRGIPFTAELNAAKQLAADPSVLAPLESLASTGVPTPAALAQDLSKLGSAMMKAARPRPEGGVIERLQASAERLVRIRPVDEASGDEPSALIGRAELKATRGDIAGALADVERLPESVRAPAASWIEAAKKRLAAIAAAKSLAANALEALAKSAG